MFLVPWQVLPSAKGKAGPRVPECAVHCTAVFTASSVYPHPDQNNNLECRESSSSIGWASFYLKSSERGCAAHWYQWERPGPCKLEVNSKHGCRAALHPQRSAEATDGVLVPAWERWESPLLWTRNSDHESASWKEGGKGTGDLSLALPSWEQTKISLIVWTFHILTQAVCGKISFSFFNQPSKHTKTEIIWLCIWTSHRSVKCAAFFDCYQILMC